MSVDRQKTEFSRRVKICQNEPSAVGLPSFIHNFPSAKYRSRFQTSGGHQGQGIYKIVKVKPLSHHLVRMFQNPHRYFRRTKYNCKTPGFRYDLVFGLQ